MDIKGLTQKMNQFVSTQGWYDEDSPRPQTLINLAISLTLEAAEVLEHFQWSDDMDEPEQLGEELADVALFIPHSP
jgi:NTP pyrophosphatase (non-canonical NTP hydrolase)